jgi:tol-pal system protein YbgF
MPDRADRPALRLAAPWLVPVLLTLAMGPARAGLFDDDEARKAILDIRTRITQSDERSKAAEIELAATNVKLQEQIDGMRRSMLELNNQLELLRADLAKLRGMDEQTQRELAEMQKRQKDLGQAFDDRMRKLEPVKVTLDGREFAAEPDERKSYDDAVGLLRAGEFDQAVAALAGFQRRYPSSGYGDSVRYWLGNAQYARRDYKEAISTFRAFVTAAPEHARAPEALLALANSQAEMKDTKAARKTVEELIKAYPKSEAAQAGRERLSSLK